MTTKSDKGLLNASALEQFQSYLSAVGIEHRPGKGEYQVLQVKCGKAWLAVCRDARGLLTTPPELRLTVNNFNSGAKSAVKSKAKARDQFLEDLRDDFAMHALQGICVGLHTGEDPHGWTAEMIASDAYRIADAMLAERAQR